MSFLSNNSTCNYYTAVSATIIALTIVFFKKRGEVTPSFLLHFNYNFTSVFQFNYEAAKICTSEFTSQLHLLV